MSKTLKVYVLLECYTYGKKFRAVFSSTNDRMWELEKGDLDCWCEVFHSNNIAADNAFIKVITDHNELFVELI